MGASSLSFFCWTRPPDCVWTSVFGRRLTFKYLLPRRTMAGPKTSSQTAPSSVSHAVSALWKSYLQQTPDRLKFIDAFLAFIVLSGVIQFIYCVLVTNFPFNAFLAGYVVTAAGCVLWLTGSVVSRALLDSLSSPLRFGRKSTPKTAQSSKRCHPRGVFSLFIADMYDQRACAELLLISHWAPLCSTFLYSISLDEQVQHAPTVFIVPCVYRE